MKDIKFSKVAHLYLGCRLSDGTDLTAERLDFMQQPGTKVLPILRPKTSITETETVELLRISTGLNLIKRDIEGPSMYHTQKRFVPEQFIQLLKMRIDLFDLIKNGFALDATKERVNPYKI